MSETPAKPSRKSSSRFFRKLKGKMIVAAVNRLNFVKLIHRIASSNAARPYARLYSGIPEDWQNTEEIKKLAVDLTLDQIRSEGSDPDRQEIEALVDEIAIRYDRNLHIDCACLVGMMFDNLFAHQNPKLPFTSPDGRDLAHLEALKNYRKQGLGVIYLVNHSSHLDEFLVDILWQNLYMGLPVFAAGQNMMAIKSIEKVLMTGSYVVIRKGASRSQVAALYNYCSALSRAGAQQGIFLEAWRGGARTRDGSLRYPKRLITLQGALNVEDVVIQPVAISFSAVPEDLMMCSRKSARSWVRGMGFFRTLAKFPLHPKTFLWRAAEKLYGRAYITVPPPMLLSEIRKDHARDRTGVAIDEYIALQSIRAIARSKKIMASQLVARGLVLARKNGTKDLLSSVRSEVESIREYHLTTFGQQPDFEDFVRNHPLDEVIEDGLSTLKKRGVLKRFFKDPIGLPAVLDEIALAYYATHGDRRLYSPTADQNIVVVGAGNWGFAIAALLGRRLLEDKKYDNASLTIFDSRPDVVTHMGLNRQGTGRFADQILPKNVFVTSDHPSAFRKASDVIIASRPQEFEQHIRDILAVSEQPLRIIVGTRGFIPQMNCLPFTAVRRLISEYERRDVEILAVAGPVNPENLVGEDPIKGILAGPAAALREFSEMFQGSHVETIRSNDPIGVQTADTLARVYAIWINFLISSKRISLSSDIGFLMAAAAEETSELALALGGNPGTFSAGSIPWNATFVALSMEGEYREFGLKAGKAAKKGKDVKDAVRKLEKQMADDGHELQTLQDIQEAMICADERMIPMPVLKEIHQTFFGETVG